MMMKSAVLAPPISNSFSELLCINKFHSDTQSRLLFLLFDHNWSLASCFCVVSERQETLEWSYPVTAGSQRAEKGSGYHLVQWQQKVEATLTIFSAL